MWLRPTGVLMAADLPLRAPVVARAPLAYNWTGLYLGINGGYAWGNQDPFDVITNRFDSFSDRLNGWTFGGTVGAQVQVAHVLDRVAAAAAHADHLDLRAHVRRGHQAASDRP